MEFMNHASGEIFKFYMKQPRANDSVYHMTHLKLGHIAFKMNSFCNTKTYCWHMLRVRAKMALHVLSYDFMTPSYPMNDSHSHLIKKSISITGANSTFVMHQMYAHLHVPLIFIWTWSSSVGRRCLPAPLPLLTMKIVHNTIPTNILTLKSPDIMLILNYPKK